MPDSPVTFRPEILSGGTSLTPEIHEALATMRVVHGLGVPAYTRLSFRVGDPEVVAGIVAYDAIKTKVGDAIKVIADDGEGASWTLFDGLAVSVGVELETSFSQYVIIEAYDKLYKLGRKLAPKTFVNVTASAIIGELVKVADLSLGTVDSSLKKVTREHVYQNSTAYGLIDRLVREAGCEWYVDDGKLHARRRSTASASHTLTVGDNLLRFSARYSASEQVDEVKVTGWDVKKKEAIVGSAKFKAPGRSLSSKPTGGNVGGSLAMSIPRPVASVDDATVLAEGLLRRRESEMMRARGEAEPSPAIEPGTTLKVEGMGDQWSGEYYCTGVEHTFDARGMRTEFEVGPSEPDTLIDIFGDGESSSLRAMLGSLTVGIVTNNEDPEKLNRVKLRLPYLSDSEETTWARVLQPGSGSGRGWNVLPEVEDEVLVGFEHTDIDRPLVLGGLINGKDKPKYDHSGTLKDGAVVARVFNSRLGHEFRFADGTGTKDQFITVHTAQKEATLFLGVERIDLQADGIPVKVFNDRGSIEITKDGDILLQGANISLKADQDITIEAKANVNIKSKASTTLDAKAKLDIKAAGPATLESSAITSVKGSMVNIN